MTLFAGALQQFEPDDVRVALREIGRRKRQQFESSIPDLGTLIEACQSARRKRIETYFPPKPDLAQEIYKSRPLFEPCSGPHFGTGSTAYLDADGNPVSADKSPDRVLGPCKCLREFRQREREWERDVWYPHMREVREWEAQCDLIRRQHLQLGEVA